MIEEAAASRQVVIGAQRDPRTEIPKSEIQKSVPGLVGSRHQPVRDLSEADVQHADAPTGRPADCREGISPDINPGAGHAGHAGHAGKCRAAR